MISVRQNYSVVNEEVSIAALDNFEALKSFKKVKKIKRDRHHCALQKCLILIQKLKRDIEEKKVHFSKNERLREEQIKDVLRQAMLARYNIEGIYATQNEISQIKLASMIERQDIEHVKKQLIKRCEEQQSLSEIFHIAERNLEKAQYLIDREVSYGPQS